MKYKGVVISVFMLLVVKHTLIAQKATISGYISDKESGERLINANIYNTETLEGSTANTFGFYSLKLNKGKVNLMASFMGYTPRTISLNLTKDTVINFDLLIKSGQLDEVTVNGNDLQNKIESSQMSMNDIPIEKLKKVPQVLGEADVLKVMQLLPGVKSGVEGSSGLYVRGGGSDQNLFLLDGVPVYNASHLLGFFSVFNPDAIKSSKIYKGGFPAHYGGRLSSVVDINMKDGNMKELKGNFTVGLLSSKLMLEGPIKKDKTSFMVSARRSYVDLMLEPLLALASSDEESSTGGAFFNDYNLKLNHKFSDRSRLFLSGYFGDDNVHSKYTDNWDGDIEKEKFRIAWGNRIGSARWNYQINNKLFSNTTLTYSRYRFKISDDYYYSYSYTNDSETESTYYTYKSGIEDYAAKLDFDYYPTPKHAIKFGVNFTNHYFTPGVSQEKFSSDSSNSLDTIMGGNNATSLEWAAYIEDNFSLSEKIKINAGIYTSLFNVQGVNYLRPQPRFSLRYKVNDLWALKASYSRMAQHVHLLSYSGINLPTDIWVPVTKNFAPPVSDQEAIGTDIKLPLNLSLSVEAYYKTMNNLIAYKDGASFSSTSNNWEDKVVTGKGWTYGGEFMLEKSIGKTTGWIGYTLAWNNRKFENLNNGKTFPDKYDRRHDISIVLTHKFSDKFDIGATWVYNTGNTATLALTQYQTANITGMDYTDDIDNVESRNNYRLPANHRLDLGLNFHKQRPHSLRTWSFSIYNVYNHHSPFYIYWDRNTDSTVDIDSEGNWIKNSTTTTKLKQFSLFPIIPSISYSLKF